MNGSMMEIFRVGKRYACSGADSGFWAVRDVTLSVFSGDLTVLMGPSGSGKTTLLSMIGGLLAPTEGCLSVCSVDLHECEEHERQLFRRKNVGFVFQNYNLIESLNALENIRVSLHLRGQDKNQAHDALDQVGLGNKANAYPRELSGGQKQRVAIARALAGRPPLLLADEPTAALDAEQGRHVMALLRKRARELGTAVLVVTHDPRVREFSDRVIEMEDGRLRRIVRRLRRNIVPHTRPKRGKLSPRLQEAFHGRS